MICMSFSEKCVNTKIGMSFSQTTIVVMIDILYIYVNVVNSYLILSLLNSLLFDSLVIVRFILLDHK